MNLHPCEWRADAEMDAAAKAGVHGAVAIRIERVGVGVGRRITVRACQQTPHFIPAFKVMTKNRHVLIDPTHEHMERWIEAQDFFGGCGRHIRFVIFNQGLDAIS